MTDIDPTAQEAATLEERLSVGTRVARRALAGGPMHFPENLQLKAAAHGVYAWRELLVGVLGGDADAIVFARQAVHAHLPPEPKAKPKGA